MPSPSVPAWVSPPTSRSWPAGWPSRSLAHSSSTPTRSPRPPVAAPRCAPPPLRPTVAEVQRDRVGTASHVATTNGVHVALKGATTVVAVPDGRVFLNPTGNPGMASGGTGDALTGILGALLARRMDPTDALVAA